MTQQEEDKLREEFREFCNTDNFSAPPYETDTIADFWLKKISNLKKSIREEIESKKTKDTNGKTYHAEHPDVIKDKIIDEILSLKSLE